MKDWIFFSQDQELGKDYHALLVYIVLEILSSAIMQEIKDI